MANLYELSAGYASLLNTLESAQTDEEREEILALLANTEGDISEKAEAYAKIIRNKEAESEALRHEAGRLADKAKVAENVVKRLKRAMMDSMRLMNVDTVATPIGKWRIQDNPWNCEIRDASLVPMQYHIKQEDKIDKAGLLKAFRETGEMVDGVLFSREQGIRFR